jgi:hypothetical protein
MNSANPMSFERKWCRMPPERSPELNQIRRAYEVKPPTPDEAFSARTCREDRRSPVECLTLAVLAALPLAWLGGAHLIGGGSPPLGNGAVKAVVERIIIRESGGDSNAQNKRSSAAGIGQFLDDTWLEMIRTYRHDLIEGRSEKELLELRRDPELTRLITTRLVEQNAAMLKKRGLPVTPGSLYLAHFAGPAGAVALLSVAENADAASLLASADATGRTTREKLVKANPFLKELTVGDLKSWADRKMRSY